eukprot:2932600-Rhodomonas_salina.1
MRRATQCCRTTSSFRRQSVPTWYLGAYWSWARGYLQVSGARFKRHTRPVAPVAASVLARTACQSQRQLTRCRPESEIGDTITVTPALSKAESGSPTRWAAERDDKHPTAAAGAQTASS